MVGGELQGDPSSVVSAVAPLDRAESHHLTFLANAKYAEIAAARPLGVVLVTRALAESCAARARIVVDDPHEAMLSLLPLLYPAVPNQPGIHQTTVLGRGVTLGDDVSIGPYVVVGDGAVIGARTRIDAHAVLGAGVTVGDDCHLYPGVTLYSGTALGARVRVHAGARLGSDGFGYVFRDGAHEKIPHVGRCIIEADVEIGANTTIDRGSIDDTVIGAGTKIDNLVHVAHNVRIGRLCLIMAQVGIAGSTRIEDGAILAGQAGIAGHVTIGRGARIGAQGGVFGDVPAGETWSGYPARPHREALRAQAAMFKLPSLMRAIERLIARDAEGEPLMRRTIAREATVAGTGLHLGVDCSLRFQPAPSGSGIVFQRRDLAGATPIPARADHAVLTERRTQLGEEPNAVHTVEHVLAAVSALELDDLVISLDGPEPPIMDGSASAFFGALREAGFREQPGCTQNARLTRRIELTDGDSMYEATPSEHLDLEVTIDFPHALIGRQRYAGRVTTELFERELAWARTFGFVREVEPLRAMGLIKGATLQNAVVLDDTSVVENALRSPDEFVRHKMMDCVGDLALAGARFEGAHRGAQTQSSRHGAVRARDAGVVGAGDSGARYRRDHEGAAAPVSLSAGGPGAGDRAREADRRHQERDDQRTVLSGPLSRPPDHAGRADHRGDGAGGRDAAHGRRIGSRSRRSCTSRRSTT